ncbi:hypothetical protein GX51_00614 [Blastomyces parvus]|uniref:Uncharacterized protein n=1 Tax=Blastomyces parvus TaxID=2060905 RepID=A0A2B7XKP6_9EURO|nr:hypothetical protein GX51_00614 [Blastomyces parvus]
MCRPDNTCFDDEWSGRSYHSYACTVSDWDNPKCPWRCFKRDKSNNYTFKTCDEDPSLIQCTVNSFTTCYPKTDVDYQTGSPTPAFTTLSNPDQPPAPPPRPTPQTTTLPKPPAPKSKSPNPPNRQNRQNSPNSPNYPNSPNPRNPPLPENSSQISAAASPTASGIPEQGPPLDDHNTKAIRIGVAVGVGVGVGFPLLVLAAMLIWRHSKRQAKHQQTAADIQVSPDSNAETMVTATCHKPSIMGPAARFPVELDSQLVPQAEADLPRYELEGGEVKCSNSHIQPEDPGKESGIEACENSKQK